MDTTQRPFKTGFLPSPVLPTSPTMLLLNDVRKSMVSTFRDCFKRAEREHSAMDCMSTMDGRPTVSPHRLFTTPELIHAILNQIDSPADLSRSARVSRLWFQEAVPILWRGDIRKTGPWRSPDVDFLAKFAARNPVRLAQYLSWVKNLVLCQRASQVSKGTLNADALFDPSVWRMFSGKLVNLDLKSIDIQEHHILSLLNSKLEELYLRKAKYSPKILTQLKVTSPRLAELAVGDDESSILPLPELLQFLQQSTVKDLSLRKGYQDAIDAHALTQILSLPLLERLFLDDLKIQTVDLQGINLAAPLKLTQLTLRTDDSTPLRPLILNLPELKKLVVEFCGSSGDMNLDVVDPLIQTCPNLQLLRLSSPELPLDGNRLEKLAQRCPEMETMMVFPNSWTNCDYKLHASQVTYATSHWPKIRNLFLHQPLEAFTASHLIDIGRSCPKLKLLGLYGNLDSDGFQTLSEYDSANDRPSLDTMDIVEDRPLFPCLRVLDIGFTIPSCSSALSASSFLIRPEDIQQPVLTSSSSSSSVSTSALSFSQDTHSISSPCTHNLHSSAVAQQQQQQQSSSANGTITTTSPSRSASKFSTAPISTVKSAPAPKPKPVKYHLQPNATTDISTRIETVFLNIMPKLIMLSHNYNYYTEYPSASMSPTPSSAISMSPSPSQFPSSLSSPRSSFSSASSSSSSSASPSPSPSEYFSSSSSTYSSSQSRSSSPSIPTDLTTPVSPSLPPINTEINTNKDVKPRAQSPTPVSIHASFSASTPAPALWAESQEDIHDRISADLNRRFEARFPSLICEKGWCECWRAGLD